MRSIWKNLITNMVLVMAAAAFAACGGTYETADAGSPDTSAPDVQQDNGSDVSNGTDAAVDTADNGPDISVNSPDVQQQDTQSVDIAPPPKCGEYDCDDKNPCTNDVCDLAKGCTHTDNTAVCNDGNPSTSGDVCFLGVCSGQLAVAPVVECGDAKMVDAICEDFDACTIDACLSGKCVHKAMVCDDGVDCTADSCDKQLGCINKTDDTKCGVGTKCWNSNYQQKGGCSQCDPSYDTSYAPLCNDNNDCTADKCVSGKCVSTPNTNMEGDYCNDGNACTAYQDSQCKDAKCVATVNNPCDDGNTCTADSCDIKGGCAHSSLNGVCDDGVACTVGDYCQGGDCYSGNANCEDGNPCTTDYCSSGSGTCQHPLSSGAACNDGNPCTVGDKCSNGACAVGTSVNCDDNNACTSDYCQLGMCGHTAIANCGGTVPPPLVVFATLVFTSPVLVEVQAFWTFDPLYPLAGNAQLLPSPMTVKLSQFQACGGDGVDIAARDPITKKYWCGVGDGTPSKSQIGVSVNGLLAIPTFQIEAQACSGGAEGNLHLSKAQLGCP